MNMHAGLPVNEYTTYCPANGASCYFYNRTSANYTTHRSSCQARGGYLVAFNSAEEQELVEAWFVTTTTAMSGQTPWIGVEQAGSQWWAAAGIVLPKRPQDLKPAVSVFCQPSAWWLAVPWLRPAMRAATQAIQPEEKCSVMALGHLH